MNQISRQFKSFIALFILLLFTGGCSDDEPADDATSLLGDVDPALVGAWQGRVNGSFGAADLIMMLNADASITAEGSTSLYCPFSGKWGVVGLEFNAKGNDGCDGTFVTFSASVSADSLVGTWFASSGTSGDFSVGRQ